jgi:hypothetical protein
MERLDEFEEERCKWFVRREPLAQVAYESREALCVGFVRREPLAEVIRPFIGDRCERFACRKRLAEMLHGFEEARCECFSGREPLAAALSPFDDELGEFDADRGSFEEPLREGPAGRNPRAERLSSHRDDASLPREVLPTFSSRLSSNSQAARLVERRRARRLATPRWKRASRNACSQAWDARDDAESVGRFLGRTAATPGVIVALLRGRVERDRNAALPDARSS